ncbi:MAG TPA: type II secretion system minor pseudopilin GspI [Candidatus Competibacter sp.]|nr:type II secretion system minor pseudopilin GspI [Candidatus Competibacter sp.]
MKRAAGFTLLEVLVALAVLAIAMGAIISVATQSANTIGYLRDQTFAGWVALNKINELSLDPEPWPERGGRKGNSELANRAWFWEARFQKTSDSDLTALEIVVRPREGGSALSALTAFKSRPPKDETAADPEQATTPPPTSVPTAKPKPPP